jgi:hypothetical protein
VLDRTTRTVVSAVDSDSRFLFAANAVWIFVRGAVWRSQTVRPSAVALDTARTREASYRKRMQCVLLAA